MTGDILCWGSHKHGQLGLGGIDDEFIASPKRLEFAWPAEVKSVICGELHTLFLLKNGRVYACGNNDFGQLGHGGPRTRPYPVEALAAHHIIRVACGSTFSCALNEDGQIFTWGHNKHGQLGRQCDSQEQEATPKIVKHLASMKSVQVACGDEHMLSLMENGQLFAWGNNQYGQLGLGYQHDVNLPTQILSLAPIPIAQITCGASHSLILTKSGAVFGWGKNNYGQLGNNTTTDSSQPCQLKTLRNQKIKFISCGEEHSAALTSDGGVFTFGCGSLGRLGHNGCNNEILPRQVIELMGSEVSQIICGRKHTLSLALKSGRLYAFGLGGSGQLGIGEAKNFLDSPFPVQAPFIAYTKQGAPQSGSNAIFIVTQIFTGGDHCFALVSTPQCPVPPVDFRVQTPSDQILSLGTEPESLLSRLVEGVEPSAENSRELDVILTSPACMNASFLTSNDGHMCCNSKNHGVNLVAARLGLVKLQNVHDSVISIMIISFEQLLSSLPPVVPDSEALRLYLTLPECFLFSDTSLYINLICPLAARIIALDKIAGEYIQLWWGKLEAQQFGRLIQIFKNVVVHILNQGPVLNNDPNYQQEVSRREMCMLVSMEILRKLNVVNMSQGQIVPYRSFYIPELIDKVDIRRDYLQWMREVAMESRLCHPKTNPNIQLFFCNYPFVFDAQVKTLLLQTDAVIQMQHAVEEVTRRHFLTPFMPVPIDNSQPFLVLFVSRSTIVQDTLQQLAKYGPGDFKKPLQVRFVGEEALDAGGVRKEFFILLLRRILDPQYYMFIYYEESRTIWFNDLSFEDTNMFHLIGILCGLAIYNSVIIDLPFPLALYKKLLEEKITLEDLKELSPTVARGLQQLLDYDGDDVEEMFGLTFEIPRERFGEIQYVQLKERGNEIAVNKQNRQEYVDLYVDFLLNKSVHDQFVAFSQGFHKVCGSKILALFHAQELMAMVVGNENYDFDEFEKVTEYKGEYWRKHPTIQMFWEVFHSLNLEQKKKFLIFLTGSDRVPILGMKSIRMIIQPMVDTKYWPVAHVCFNLLDLPKYEDKEMLQQKLLEAIEHNAGFTLV